MIVWGVVVALLLVLVLIIGIKDKDYNYARLESSIKKATRSYILNNKMTPKISQSIVIDIKELIKDKYIDSKDIDKYCIKDVVFQNGLFYDNYTIEKKCDNKEK